MKKESWNIKMKLTIDAKSFVDAVGWATKSYDAKNDRAYVLLSVDADGKGFLSHAGLGSYMKCDFTVVSVDFSNDKSDSAQFALEGKYLQRLAAAISTKGEIRLTKDLNSSKTSLEMKTSTGRFTIPMTNSRIAADPEVSSIGTVDDNEFFDSLRRIGKLCDPANVGQTNFIGSVDIGFDFDKGLVKLFATDRYAMAEMVMDFSGDEGVEMGHLLIPHASAMLVPPTKGLNMSINLITDQDGRFGYSFPDGRVALFTLTAADVFKNVEVMKTKQRELVEHSITVPTGELTDAIRAVSSLDWDSNDIFLTIDSENGLIVSDRNNTNKLSVSNIDLNYDGDEAHRDSFVRAVINEAFSPISTPYVKLKWSSQGGVFLFVPVTDDGDEVETVFVMAVVSNKQ